MMLAHQNKLLDKLLLRYLRGLLLINTVVLVDPHFPMSLIINYHHSFSRVENTKQIDQYLKPN